MVHQYTAEQKLDIWFGPAQIEEIVQKYNTYSKDVLQADRTLRDIRLELKLFKKRFA